jgi:hypothetical protein
MGLKNQKRFSEKQKKSAEMPPVPVEVARSIKNAVGGRVKKK